MNDPHDLYRFVEAQETSYANALSEIRAGRKRTHWMWYLFPQFEGLGYSPTTRHFSIKSLREAIAYLEHPLLGPRLAECCESLLSLDGRSARQIFGTPDDLKLKSSMTLFALVSREGSLYERVLAKYFDGQRDDSTLELVESQNQADIGSGS